jgi:hypothetical protein
MFYIGKSKRGYSRINSKSIWMSDNDFGAFANNPESMQNYYLSLFDSASRKYSYTFRVYLTAHGMRSFIVNAIDVPSGINILRETNSDPYYIMAVMRDKEFSCRISPKTKSPPEKFAITKYLITISNGLPIKEIKEFIDFHDSETRAFSVFQLV